MDCVWDWLQNLVNVLAVPTFLLLIWQIMRTETTQPPDNFRFLVKGTLGSPRIKTLTAHPYGGKIVTDGEISVIEGRQLSSSDEELSVPTCTEEHPLRTRFMLNDDNQAVILVSWHENSLIRKRSIAHARRLTITFDGRNDLVEIERWKWHWYAAPARQANRFLARWSPRHQMALGRWARNRKPDARLLLPDNAGRLPRR